MIFICSKGRPNGITFDLLKDSGLDYTVFVEPQEFESYRRFHKSVVDIGHDDRGIVFARQFVLDYARGEDVDWYWTLDDDIKNFFMARNSRNERISASEGLSECKKIYDELGVQHGGMEYSQFSWSANKGVVSPSYCDVAVYIKPMELFCVNYDNHAGLKEDRDFTLQCATSGYKVAKVKHISFSTQKYGTGSGGLAGTYTPDNEMKVSKYLTGKWPHLTRFIVKKTGRADVKIYWNRIK